MGVQLNQHQTLNVVVCCQHLFQPRRQHISSCWHPDPQVELKQGLGSLVLDKLGLQCCICNAHQALHCHEQPLLPSNVTKAPMCVRHQLHGNASIDDHIHNDPQQVRVQPLTESWRNANLR